MAQIIALVFFVLILVFIYKVGSFLWRTIGFLLLLFLLWVFRAEIFSQINQWTQGFRWNELSIYFGRFVQWFQGIWHSFSQWVTSILNG